MTVIDDYLENATPEQQTALERVRKIVKQVVPDADEVISYGMPVFKLNGKYILGIAAFKDHMSLFPGSEPVEDLKEKLKEFKTSKGTIQFTAERPIPEELIREITSACLARI